MPSEDAVLIHALLTLSEVGPKKAVPWASRYSVDSFPQTEEELVAAFGKSLFERNRQQLLSFEKTVHESERVLDAYAEAGIATVCYRDTGYPARLRDIRDWPAILYVKGSIDALSAHSVAVIGTRSPLPRSEEVARRVTEQFVTAGFSIVSGLALGIDTCAHESAIEAGGITVAVLGNPIDQVYPASNAALAKRILESGGSLVAEIEPGQKSGRHQFVQRDRIQAGLAEAVVPVQTASGGGTMHTVRFAERYGRTILCPRITDDLLQLESFSGNRDLISEGRCQEFDKADYYRLRSLVASDCIAAEGDAEQLQLLGDE